MIKSFVGVRHTVLAVLGTVLTLSLSTPAHAEAAAVPDGNVTVEVIAANGSGCAPGSATVIADSDKTGFRIRYHDFVAEAGGSADPTDRRKNCQVGVLVTVPAGWTFAVAEADYRGRARLHAGATALQRTNYYWQGSSANNSNDETFSGPLHGYWATRDVAPALIYTPCSEQKVLNVNTELRVDAGPSNARSSMSMRSSEGDVDTLFNFSWIRC
ncbi:DUF4360 domain-containing protein [Actinoplanes auranticolor]|uniref:DUF4360 domain-containing protein n=1 Tax=Actinoplanes auranticolor TaxID=47988 RepID=A0A919VIP1_9ACTN|nr:DUF4360 domain-containing protein [Actinoplanes auranticolor]GIM67279.1 hypothetical protein Aau02nite_26720 [Actinoplanes auranticolor]